MTSIRKPNSALRTALVALSIAMLSLTAALPAWADGYQYDIDRLSISGTAGSSSPFAPGDKIEVDFAVTTKDTAHDWLGNGSGGDWEDGRVFRVSLAVPSSSAAFSAFDAFDCYSNSVARRSPVVRSSSEADPNNQVDGAGNVAEPATHAGEPVIGGHVLTLSNAQVGAVKSTRHDDDSVEANGNGEFLVDAELPTQLEFPTGYEAKEVLLCVESVDLYGDEGNVGVDVNGDRHNTGVGLHCDNDLTNDEDQFCFDSGGDSGPVYSEDGMCFSFCTTYNSTPRIQAATRITLERQELPQSLPPNRATGPPDTTQ